MSTIALLARLRWLAFCAAILAALPCAAGPPLVTVLHWSASLGVNPYRWDAPGCSTYDFAFDQPAAFFRQTGCAGNGPTASYAAASVSVVSNTTGVSLAAEEAVSTAATPAGDPDYRACIRPRAATDVYVQFALSKASVMTMSLSSSMLLPSWVRGPSPSDTLPADSRVFVSSQTGYPQGSFRNVPEGYAHPSGGFGMGQYCYCSSHAPWFETFQAFADPGVYGYQTYSWSGYPTLTCHADRSPTPAGFGSVHMSGSVSFEPCLTITQQPPANADVCNGGTLVIGVSANAPTAAGALTHQWQWRPTPVTSWSNIQNGVNSRGGVTFTTPNAQSNGVILDFSPGHGTLPPGARPEFRCYVSNTCTNETSDTAVVTGCEAPCSEPLGSHPAKWKKARCVNGQMVLEEVQTTDPGAPGYFDCNLPTALIFHGFASGPDADWIPCLACRVTEMFPSGVNVLAADARAYMQPDAMDVLQAMINASGSAAAGGGVPGVARSLAEDATMFFLEARKDTVAAGMELADDFYCHLGNCPQSPGVPLVIGHSFGGAIAASFAAEIRFRGGPPLGTLVSIDTPWALTFLGSQADQATAGFQNHFNYFSDRRITFGVGNELDPTSHPSVRNFQANAYISDMRYRCPFPPIDHTCLPNLACDFFGSSAGGQALDGTLAPGDYHEGETPFVPLAGLGAGYPISPTRGWGIDRITNDQCHVIRSNLQNDFRYGNNFAVSNSVLTVSSSGSQTVGTAIDSFEFPASVGFLVFEFQVAGSPAGQQATLRRGQSIVWGASEPTPPGSWATAIVALSSFAGSPGSLEFTLARASNASPAAEVRIRNARLLSAAVLTDLSDFDFDGFVNSNDFFSFLTAFFQSNLDADLNNDDVVNSQDFFDFLAAFFTGC